MKAVVWSDYLCPWCYVGLDRTALLRDLGVAVLTLPFELHPEIPADGRGIGSRGARLYDQIAAECEQVGLPFNPPHHVPNTRRVLETAEWVRQNDPDSFEDLHQSLFRAHFVDGLDIGDRDVVDDLVRASGSDAAAARSEVDAGRLKPVIDECMHTALEAGATGTPSWLIGTLLLPGLQPRDLYERVVTKLRAREQATG